MRIANLIQGFAKTAGKIQRGNRKIEITGKYLVVLLVLILIGTAFSANTLAQSSPVDDLYAELKKALREISSSNSKLERQYLEALQKLRDQAASTGDLGQIDVIHEEIDRYRMPGARDFEKFPALEKMRALYEKSREKIDADLRKTQLAVLKIHGDRFGMLTETLTREGKTAEVVRANRYLKKIEEAIADPEKIEQFSVLWTLEFRDDAERVKGIVLDRKGGRFVLSSEQKAGSYIKTRPHFEPPFVISTRVGTDSVNIRYFWRSKTLTIFNWEVNRGQLRLHDPASGKQRGINGMGYVKENELHDIRIVFTKERISIYANGELRGTMEGNYSGLKGQVGIGPAFGSSLTLEKFEIRPLYPL